MTIHKVSVSLEGIRKFAWRKNLHGFFSVNGRTLTNAEVRKVVEYGIKKGYKTNEDIPTEEVIKLLGWEDNNDRYIDIRDGSVYRHNHGQQQIPELF